ncbi:MAG TPA: glutaminyl-peptide cyclotransferase [Rhizomicrobium sp.]|nr:glutaminyl-peptide cyclotransferase [Rhizomicrobium sp.]
MRALLLRRLLFVPLLSLPLLSSPGAAAEKCPIPKKLSFQAEGEIRRDTVGFTEGLEAHDGAIYESTGDFFGETRINRIDPQTGHVSVLMNAGKSYFGEGMTFFGDLLYQMTYREHRVFVFDKTMRKVREFPNPREGWGLTHDESQLIASDGSNRLYFLSPQDFSTRRVLSVFDQGRRVRNLNELEYVQGAIWANIFEEWSLVRISPRTGCVEARADLQPLRALMSAADRHAIDSDENFVPNGIAYSPASGLFIVTGKYWPMLYTGRFVEAN